MHEQIAQDQQVAFHINCTCFINSLGEQRIQRIVARDVVVCGLPGSVIDLRSFLSYIQPHIHHTLTGLAGASLYITTLADMKIPYTKYCTC